MQRLRIMTSVLLLGLAACGASDSSSTLGSDIPRGGNVLLISLDTLRADRFLELTRRDELERALRGLDAAAAAGFRETKLNVVVMRGTNDDELVDMLDFARERELDVVTFRDWQKIEEAEIAAARAGAPREKFVDIASMIAARGE